LILINLSGGVPDDAGAAAQIVTIVNSFGATIAACGRP